jgi:hypothetical protein
VEEDEGVEAEAAGAAFLARGAGESGRSCSEDDMSILRFGKERILRLLWAWYKLRQWDKVR